MTFLKWLLTYTCLLALLCGLFNISLKIAVKGEYSTITIANIASAVHCDLLSKSKYT